MTDEEKTEEFPLNFKNRLDIYSKEELKDLLTQLFTAFNSLTSRLVDAEDLLNNCGYELIDGVWRDMEYYPYDLE